MNAFILDLLYTSSLSFCIVLISMLMILLGHRLFVNSNPFKPDNQVGRIAIYFFVGLSLFLSIWSIFSLITSSAKVSLFLTILVSTGLGIWGVFSSKSNTTRKIPVKLILILLSLFVLFEAFYIFLSLVPMTDVVLNEKSTLNPWAGNTTIVHGFRAVNITLESHRANLFPVIKQNVAQSVLSLMTMIFGFKSPFLALIIWKSVCVFFFYLLNLGLFIELKFSKLKSIFATLAVFFCGSLYTAQYLSITDVGSTLFQINNLDIVIGLATFLIFFICMSSFVLREDSNGLKFNYYPLLVILVFSWSLSSSHLFFLSIIVIILMTFLRAMVAVKKTLVAANVSVLLRKDIPPIIKTTLALILTITMAALLGGFIGGFFLFTEPNISYLPIRPLAHAKIAFRGFSNPELFIWPKSAWYPFHYSGLFADISDISQSLFLKMRGLKAGFQHGIKVYKVIIACSFFPIIGYIIMAFRFYSSCKDRKKLNLENILFFNAFVLFLAGSIIAVCFHFGPFSRELTRFWQPGIYFSAFVFVFSVTSTFSGVISRKPHRLIIQSILSIFLFLSLLASTQEALRWVISNYVHHGTTIPEYFGQTGSKVEEKKCISLAERLHFFVTHNRTVPR